MTDILLIASLFLSGVGVCMALLYSIAIVRKARPSERNHMDPLPWGARLLWPAINVFQYHIAEAAPTSYLLRTKRLLQLAGLEYVFRPAEFISLRVIGFIAGLIVGGFCNHFFSVSWRYAPLVVVGVATIGWNFPSLWLSDKRKRREKEILRTLPGYLDLITLCCQAGLGLTSAISQAVQKGPRGALHDEFERLLREMRTGMTRKDALNAMAERMDNKNVRGLVSSLTQAESLGASVADTLAAISDQRRTERFQHAEKLAMEAPVKMLGPLVIFIFPCTFIVIFFPLAVQMYQTLKG